MAEINEAGYQSLRDHIETGGGENWEFIELRDDTGAAVLRLSESGDDRVNWTHTAGDQVLTLEVIISGDDSDVELPQTFAESAIYDAATEGEEYSSEEFSAFTLENGEDQLTVRHDIEVPQL